MDIRTKTNLKKVLYAMRYKLFFLILFFSIAFGSLFYVHKILIEKTHLSGAAMTHSYTIEQEKISVPIQPPCSLPEKNLKRL